ncbi:MULTISPECIES: thiopeptide-type bacteriocin biosynthesis protein [unclassified Streptomyces]|uniref:thiopeptide-type bacteriocin biosynthesis protein n=1 Tax=unclassified Streptomyces TaxID=2593676 RepID=UPI002E2E063C|nr:thiopeptide-type bacteriocin biosynthesis protein [Streptomyces sp. NBC_01423]WSX92970.1 thiopeptide-type bacteriocin biosynthesis protein [Streptomyces sp. NBC_00891]WSY07447.1 thiopeptide-type bacteriocin biosynthesis protein [Streptomyces sp. NBC_00890]WSZ09072.1 thiopeptide-type bacteriocin biosynthesis protein [Streptomyces sp. NBC_00869]WSZ23429.1 thiopeptide-type bacteriocin biosynthesis protein [Streptomyces sp. NBC_00870]
MLTEPHFPDPGRSGLPPFPRTAAEEAVFVAGGRAALAQWRDGPSWIQLSLALKRPPAAAVYRTLATATRRLVDGGSADHSFFLHKPPGIRWRLRVPAGTAEDIPNVGSLSPPAAVLAGQARDLVVRAGLGDLAVSRAWYEPQQALFGGRRSMEFVHALWSADSRMWLEWHSEDTPGDPARLSLPVLAALFRGLGIQGWEDREIWDLIARETGRRLTPAMWARPDVRQAAARLRETWDRAWTGTGPADGVPQEGRTAGPSRRFREQTEDIVAEWSRTSFLTGESSVGPRRAAARWTVFHWNRAGLGLGRQALIAEALARYDA